MNLVKNNSKILREGYSKFEFTKGAGECRPTLMAPSAPTLQYL